MAGRLDRAYEGFVRGGELACKGTAGARQTSHRGRPLAGSIQDVETEIFDSLTKIRPQIHRSSSSSNLPIQVFHGQRQNSCNPLYRLWV